MIKLFFTLAFDRAGGQAPDEVALKDQERHDDRKDGDERAGHAHIPLRDRLQINKPELERQGKPVRVIEHHRGKNIGVPTADEVQDGHRRHRRQRERQEDLEVHLPFIAAINSGV